MNYTDFNYQLVDNKIDDKKKYIDDISNRSKDLADSKKAELNKSITDVANYEEDIKKVRVDIAELQKQVIDQSKINGKHKKLHNMEAKLENTCNKHKKDLSFFQSHNDCPTCQQSIDEAFKSTMISKKAEKVQELEIALGQIETEIKNKEYRIEEAEREFRYLLLLYFLNWCIATVTCIRKLSFVHVAFLRAQKQNFRNESAFN